MGMWLGCGGVVVGLWRAVVELWWDCGWDVVGLWWAVVGRGAVWCSLLFRANFEHLDQTTEQIFMKVAR